MNYIFLDMEWNQPYGKANAVTEPVYLYGEIIRIGAVKVTEDMTVSDRYHGCVIPKYYKKMNSSVGKVTGLGSRSITYGMKFPSAYQRFAQWCGDDCVFIVWGSEDEKILETNLAVHGMKPLCGGRFYNLQLIFAHKILCDGRQVSLSKAVEYYDIEQSLKAHDALNDAVYTAQVGIAMNFTEYLSEYDELLKMLEEQKNEKYFRTYQNIPSIDAALSSRRIMTCRCPVCGRLMKRKKWAFFNDDIVISYACCTEHGEYYVRLKMTRCPDGTYSVTRRYSRMTAQYREHYRKTVEEGAVTI